MTSIELEIHSGDPDVVAVIEGYWRLAEDGESWAQTVTEVRSKFGLKQQELTQLLQTCATAYLPDITCPQCDEPHVVTSRSSFAEVLRQGNVLCGTCRADAQAERERAERERAVRRRAALTEVFPVFSSDPIEAEDLTLFEAVALHALFSDPAVEDAGATTPTNIWPKDRGWAPVRLRIDYERRLLHSRPPKICVYPESHPNAFVLGGRHPQRPDLSRGSQLLPARPGEELERPAAQATHPAQPSLP